MILSAIPLRGKIALPEGAEPWPAGRISTVAKLKLIVLEGTGNGNVIEAQFNPKEIQIDKSISWLQQASGSPSDLKYTAGEARVLSFELLLDGFSTGTSIQGAIQSLEALTEPDATLIGRPPKLRVVWSADTLRSYLPKFDGVIDKLRVTYTMIDQDGKPLRATVALSLKEAVHLAVEV